MTYFVLAFRRGRGEVIERHDYSVAERDQAWTLRDQLALRYALDPDVEVVLLGAESEAELRRTHGRYFERVAPTLP
ncbi:MAG: hypothetical protein U0793_00035 [Gemmataceae bacterium]